MRWTYTPCKLLGRKNWEQVIFAWFPVKIDHYDVYVWLEPVLKVVEVKKRPGDFNWVSYYFIPEGTDASDRSRKFSP